MTIDDIKTLPEPLREEVLHYAAYLRDTQTHAKSRARTTWRTIEPAKTRDGGSVSDVLIAQRDEERW